MTMERTGSGTLALHSPAFRYALRDGLIEQQVEIRLSHIGDFEDGERELELRLTTSSQHGSLADVEKSVRNVLAARPCGMKKRFAAAW